MKITQVEALYLRLPEVNDRADGTQDTLIVRVHTDAGITGIGEVDSSPLVAKAIIEAPMSHFIAKGLAACVIGEDPLEIELLWQKLRTGRLEGRLGEIQAVGRLLSTRQREVQLAGRGRIVIPEGFRELLGVEPGESVVVVGAILCIELWHPQKWNEQIGDQMPEFRTMFEQLVG